MSRLTKHLESLMSKKDKHRSSNTTASEYYVIDGIKIRVSDHFGVHKADLQIVTPINSGTLYLVQIKEGFNILQFSFKDLKVFISNYCYINKIRSNNREVKKNKELFKSNSEVATKSVSKVPEEFSYLKDIYTSDGKKWPEVCNFLNEKYKWFEKTNPAKRRILRNSLYNKNMMEIVTIMEDIHNQNLHLRTTSDSKLEKYFELGE